ncbi:MAG: sensor histidine kinase [Candidatus Margulisbacteria bacterium]|nr:sensor histidine kinase [Candidatus Margulisiibacteriota bacterium]
MHHTICDYITDITQNSIEAGASLISIDFKDSNNIIEVIITDNGKGMDEETIKKVLDPFYTDSDKKHERDVGLGLPFLAQGIQQSQGEIYIQSEKDKGTTIKFSFNTKNIDTPPIGDKIITYLSLINFPGEFNLAIQEYKETEKTSFSKKELVEALGDINTSESLSLLKKYLKDNIL